MVCMSLQLWEAVSGECVATLTGHKEEVLDVCFDLSGQLVATASADGETHIILFIHITDGSISYKSLQEFCVVLITC